MITWHARVDEDGGPLLMVCIDGLETEGYAPSGDEWTAAELTLAAKWAETPDLAFGPEEEDK